MASLQMEIIVRIYLIIIPVEDALRGFAAEHREAFALFLFVSKKIGLPGDIAILQHIQAMKFYGRQSEGNAERILDGFKEFQEAAGNTPELQEIYNELKFEFEYYR